MQEYPFKRRLGYVKMIIKKRLNKPNVPFSGRNQTFRQTVIGNKPYVLVLNKADLADLKDRKAILEKLERLDYKSCLFTSFRNPKDHNTRKVNLTRKAQIVISFYFIRKLCFQRFYLKS
jgi:hypothetical protein